MRLNNLQAHNFGSFNDMDRSFKEEEDLIGVLGWWKDNPKKSIGSGKSTFLELILYIRYGRGRTNKAVESLIKTGHLDMWGSMTFTTANGEEVYIKRETKMRGVDKNKASSNMTVMVNGDLKAEGVMDSEAYLNKILDIPYETFIATSFFVQEKADAFTSATATERKEYLRRLEPDTTIFEEARQLAVKKSTKLSTEIGELQAVVRAHQAKMDSFNLEETNLRIKELEVRIKLNEKTIEDLGQKQREYEAREANRTSNAKVIKEIETLQSEYDNIKQNDNTVSKSNANSDLITKYKKQLFVGEFDINQLEYAKIEEDEHKDIKRTAFINMQHAKSRLELIKAGKCPTCGKPTEDTDPAQIEAEIINYNKVIDDETVKIKSLMEYVAKLETDKDKITQNDVLNVKIKACEEAIKILMETHKSIEKELSSKHTKIKELQKEIIVIDDDIYDRTGEIATCNKDINDCHAQISTNKAIIAGIKQAEDDIKDVTEQIVYKQSLEAIYDEISYAFGKDGIPNLIVENILVEIEEIANSIVQDISPEIRIFFQTQKESKKKTKIETLDIMIEYDDKVRLYETFSGGERTIINFSIRFAISYYMSQKLGLKTRAIEMVVLDEVFGSLCEDGREKIIAVLQQLKKKFKQIFVISHSDLKDIFPYNIQIERDRDESRIIN